MYCTSVHIIVSTPCSEYTDLGISSKDDWFHAHITFLSERNWTLSRKLKFSCWILSLFLFSFLNSFLLFLAAFIQGVRGLLMCGLTLGFFGVVLCFLGMECTYIGGADKTKDKLLLAGAVFHLAGGEYRTYTPCMCSPLWQKCFAVITSRYHRNLCSQVCQTSLATAYTSTGLPERPLPPV